MHLRWLLLASCLNVKQAGLATPDRLPKPFVLTHHARKPLEMDGGTTFHCVTGGPEEARRRAREAAGARDVRVGGGPATIRHYLKAGQIDEMHMAISPTILGRGEPVFEGLDLRALGYKVTRQVPGEGALHTIIARA